jgi:hypothetical protein
MNMAGESRGPARAARAWRASIYPFISDRSSEKEIHKKEYRQKGRGEQCTARDSDRDIGRPVSPSHQDLQKETERIDCVIINLSRQKYY